MFEAAQGLPDFDQGVGLLAHVTLDVGNSFFKRRHALDSHSIALVPERLNRAFNLGHARSVPG
jgi:hypothetical protein